jgi:hypothetical protein
LRERLLQYTTTPKEQLAARCRFALPCDKLRV